MKLFVYARVFVMLLLTAAAAQAQINFKAHSYFQKVDNPRHIIHADLNGDGRPDAIVTNDLKFSVLLNSASGFSEVVNHVVGPIYGAWGVSHVDAADYDGDLDIDLAVLTRDSVFILFNGGDAKFPTKKKYFTGNAKDAMASADFNGDGSVDLAIGNSFEHNVLVFLNSPSGLLPPVIYNAGTVSDLVAGDFDQDGKKDLAVANVGEHSFGVLLNQGNGSFQSMVSYMTHDYPTTLSIADFDSDGKDDLAVGFSGIKVSVFKNTGAGFVLLSEFDGSSVGGGFIRAGDFDGDMKPDIAVTHYHNKSVNIGINDGMGNFTVLTPAPIVLTPGRAQTIDIADFDLNGNPDIALAPGAGIQIWYNQGSNVFSGRTVGEGYPVAVAQGDFNGDGKVDFAAADRYTNMVSVILNDNHGGYNFSQIYPVGTEPVDIHVADFDGDGTLDLASLNITASTVSILKGVGDGSFLPQSAYSAGAGPTSGFVSDLDADGKPDIIIVNTLSNGVSILKNNGSGFTMSNHVTTDNITRCVAAGDLTGDGLPDLVIGGTRVAVLINTGSMTFAAPVYLFLQSPENIEGVAIKDFTFDNIPDVAYTKYDNITIVPNNGSAVFGPIIQRTAGSPAGAIFSDDFNGDGRKDIAVQDGTYGVSVLIAKNTLDYQTYIEFYTNGNGATITGKFDSDNRADFAVVGQTDIYLSVFKSLPDLSIVPHDTSRFYGYPNPQFKSTVTGWPGPGSPSITYTTLASITNGVGTYTFDTVPADTIAHNYSVTKTQGTLLITKAPLKITARDTVRIVGTSNPPFSAKVEGLRNDDIVNYFLITSATLASSVGDYSITPVFQFNPNYEPTLINGTLHIKPEPPIIFLPTGIGDSFQTGLYPNPSDGRFIFVNQTTSACWITDSMGKEVASMTLREGSNTIDLNLAPGLYLMHLGNGEVRKILIR